MWEQWFWKAMKSYREVVAMKAAAAAAATTAPEKKKREKGEKDWYMLWGKVAYELTKDPLFFGARSVEEKEQMLRDFLLEHVVESELMNNKVFLLNYLYSPAFSADTAHLPEEIRGTVGAGDGEQQWMEFANDVKKKWMAKVVTVRNTTGVILFDGPSRTENIQYFVLNPTTKMWSKALNEDRRDLAETLPALELPKFVANSPQSPLNDHIGFIGFETNLQYMVYKVKNMMNSRSIGFRCDFVGKGKVVEFMNQLEHTDKYSSKMSENAEELCVRQEMMMRAFNLEKRDGKVWFVPTEVAIMNEFERKDKTKATATSAKK
jgi:hypothetical protein